MHGFQRCMLAQRVQQRHQRVPLLTPFAWRHPAKGMVILPKARGRLRTEVPTLQHGIPRDSVVSANPVYGRDGGILMSHRA